MQSPRINMFAPGLLESKEDAPMLKGLTETLPGNVGNLYKDDFFPDLFAGKAKYPSHKADLDIVQLYQHNVSTPQKLLEDSFYKEAISKIKEQSFMGRLFDINVTETYPQVKDPASLFNAGIGRNGFANVIKMQEARADLGKVLNLNKFIEKMKAMLGDDFDLYMQARDRRQALNQVIANIALKYKESRRLTKEIMTNTSLLYLTDINLNDYLGLTIEKVINKLDAVIDNEAHVMNDLMNKYPDIVEIRNIYNDTAEYPLSEFVKDNIPTGLKQLENHYSR